MRRPGMRVAHQGAAAHDRAVLDCEQAGDRATLDLVDPGREHLWLADVAWQKQKVMRRQLLREGEYGRLVRARHQAKLDVASLGFDVTRVGTLLAHIDLPANQESSFGHRRRTALAPAMRET